MKSGKQIYNLSSIGRRNRKWNHQLKYLKSWIIIIQLSKNIYLSGYLSDIQIAQTMNQFSKNISTGINELLNSSDLSFLMDHNQTVFVAIIFCHTHWSNLEKHVPRTLPRAYCVLITLIHCITHTDSSL